MPKQFTIRQRILVTFLSIVLIASVIQLIIAGRQLQLSTLEFYQHHLETDALVIASTLTESMEHYREGEGTNSLQRLVVNLGQDTERDYLILARNLQILGYTAESVYNGINQVPETPEIHIASTGKIGNDVREGFDSMQYLYVAVSIQYEGEILGYLVISRSMQPAYDEVYQQWLELASTTLPVTALVVVASLWLSATISRPIQQLRNSALQMAAGAFDTRIKTNSRDEVGQLAHSFNYMAEQVEGLMQTQRSFVSNAAHELRTPLMTLKLRVEALNDQSVPLEEKNKYLQEIHQEIDHMSELVSSLLILARIDEGRHNQQNSVMDTSSALHDIARHWRIHAMQENLAFEAHIPDNLPNILLTQNDLRLVLNNLLGNAIKYTPRGKVCLSVEEREQQIKISVTDTGVGFDPSDEDKLFTRFFRSDETRTQFDGNGLGLSIVQAVLEQYSSQIEAKSEGIGTGATFTIYIPLSSNEITPTTLGKQRHNLHEDTAGSP